MAEIKDRTGETRKTKHNQTMTIIKYNNCHDIDVRFDDGVIIKNTDYRNFKSDAIKNPYRPNVHGVGYFGVGRHSSLTDRRAYDAWNKMLQRCYDDKSQNCSKGATYFGCYVDSRFHDFQFFCDWFNDNIWDENCTVLDKDILIKGNKVYSPETCILVDQRINCLFTNRSNYRGNCCIGVKYNKNHYIAQCNDSNGIRKCLGWFDTEMDAFNCYKEYKEQVIKYVADEYKQKYKNFPDKLYAAMYDYKVDFND